MSKIDRAKLTQKIFDIYMSVGKAKFTEGVRAMNTEINKQQIPPGFRLEHCGQVLCRLEYKFSGDMTYGIMERSRGLMWSTLAPGKRVYLDPDTNQCLMLFEDKLNYIKETYLRVSAD